MGLSTSELYLVLRARDEASRVLRAFGINLDTLDTKAKRAAAASLQRGAGIATLGVATVATGAVAVAALNNMTNAAIDYNQEVAKTFTQIDGVNVSMQELHDMAINVGREIAVPFEELQPTLYDIFSSITVNAPEAAMLLETIAKGAVGGQTDMQVVAQATIGMLNAYGMEVEEATHVQDIMFQLVRKGIGTYEQFTSTIGRSVPSAVMAGQSIETLAGMMAFLTRTGLSVANATVAAGRAFDVLIRPQAIANLKGWGVEVFNAQGQIRPMIDIVDDLREAFAAQGLTADEANVKLREIFKGSGGNIQAMRFWGHAINDNAGLYREMTDALLDSGGAADWAYQIMSNTPAAQVQALKNEYDIMSITIGEKLLPAKMLLLKILERILDAFNSLPEPLKNVIAYGAGLTAALVTLSGVIMILVGAFKMVRAATVLTGASFGSLWTKSKAATTGLLENALAAKTNAAATGTAARAQGLLASAFNPITLAIGVATAGIMIWMQYLSDAKARADSLSGSIDLLNGRLTETGVQTVLDRLAEGIDAIHWEKMDELGLGMDEVITAMYEGGDAVTALIDKFWENDAALTQLGITTEIITNKVNDEWKAFDRARSSAEVQTAAAKAMGLQTDATGRVVDEAADGAYDYSRILGDTADAIDYTAQKQKELARASQLVSDAISRSQALDDFREDLKNINKDLAKNQATFQNWGKGAKENRDKIRDLFSQARAESDAWAKAGGKDVNEWASHFDGKARQIVRRFIKAGFKKKDIMAFLGGQGIWTEGVSIQMQDMYNHVLPQAIAIGASLGNNLAVAFRNQVVSATQAMRLSDAAGENAKSLALQVTGGNIAPIITGGGTGGSGGSSGGSSGGNSAAEEAAAKELDRVKEGLSNLKTLLDAAAQAYRSIYDATRRQFGELSAMQNAFGKDSDISGAISMYNQMDDALKAYYGSLLEVENLSPKVEKALRAAQRAQREYLHEQVAALILLYKERTRLQESLTTLDEAYAQQQIDIGKQYDELDRQADIAVKAIAAKYDKLIPQLDTALKAASEAYERENKVLQDLLSERDKALQSIESGFRSFMNTADEGNFIAGLQSRLTKIKAFTANIKTLMTRGLDTNLVQDFIQQGVAGAGNTVAGLATGSDANIATVNDLQKQLASQTSSFQSLVSGTYYDSGIGAQQGVVSSLQAARDAAQAALDQANLDRKLDLEAAQLYQDGLKAQREQALQDALDAYETQKGEIQKQIDDINLQITAAADAINTHFTALIDPEKGLPAQMTKLGRQAVNGLIKGMQNRKDEAIAEVTQLGNDIYTALAKALDIRSPSHRLYYLGQMGMQGLINALRDSRTAVAAEMAALNQILIPDPLALSPAQYGSAGMGNQAPQQIIHQDIKITTQEIDPQKHAADLGWEFATRVRL